MKITEKMPLTYIAKRVFNIVPNDETKVSELTMELASSLMVLLCLESDYGQKQSRSVLQHAWDALSHQVEIDLANQDKIQQFKVEV